MSKERTPPNDNEAERLLRKLDSHLRVVHLDMGGKHRYTIGHKGHDVINEIRAYLYKKDGEIDGKD